MESAAKNTLNVDLQGAWMYVEKDTTTAKNCFFNPKRTQTRYDEEEKPSETSNGKIKKRKRKKSNKNLWLSILIGVVGCRWSYNRRRRRRQQRSPRITATTISYKALMYIILSSFSLLFSFDWIGRSLYCTQITQCIAHTHSYYISRMFCVRVSIIIFPSTPYSAPTTTTSSNIHSLHTMMHRTMQLYE